MNHISFSIQFALTEAEEDDEVEHGKVVLLSDAYNALQTRGVTVNVLQCLSPGAINEHFGSRMQQGCHC